MLLGVLNGKFIGYDIRVRIGRKKLFASMFIVNPFVGYITMPKLGTLGDDC